MNKFYYKYSPGDARNEFEIGKVFTWGKRKKYCGKVIAVKFNDKTMWTSVKFLILK